MQRTKLLRYEAHLDRQLYRAMDQLERLQRQRRGEKVPPPLNIDGIGAGEDRGMRGKRNRHWCENTLEANSISCHRIDVWSFNLLVAVTTDMVGAQGIDGDENNVECRFLWLFRRNLKRGKSRQGKDNCRRSQNIGES